MEHKDFDQQISIEGEGLINSYQGTNLEFQPKMADALEGFLARNRWNSVFFLKRWPQQVAVGNFDM